MFIWAIIVKLIDGGRMTPKSFLHIITHEYNFHQHKMIMFKKENQKGTYRF